MKLNLDVNKGNMIVKNDKKKIIVKEGNEDVLKWKEKDKKKNVKLYREYLYGFEIMKMGRINDNFESLNDDDDDNDENEYGDIDKGNESSEEEKRI